MEAVGFAVHTARPAGAGGTGATVAVAVTALPATWF